jgi:hypothetical protein
LNYSHHVVFFPRDGSFLLREIEEGGLIKLPINFEVRYENFLPIPIPILAGLKFVFTPQLLPLHTFHHSFLQNRYPPEQIEWANTKKKLESQYELLQLV